ncbi:MAG: hypothetical protein GXY36_07870 [Chloroflexi bacterium]|nr:hypothetical protein [Chloroflexota bacterium]
MKARSRLWIIGVVLVLIATVTAVASAKSIPYVEPLGEDWGGVADPFVSPTGGFFASYFGRLDSGDVDAIALDFDASVDDMSVELLVPECGDLFVDLYPAVAVIGPGLDRPDAGLLESLPFDLPPGAGLALLTGEQAADETIAAREKVEFYDWMYYWDDAGLSVDIPEAGQYLMVVWAPAEQIGAYALSTGGTHPDAADFPDGRELDRTMRLVSSGQWIGQDCWNSASARAEWSDLTLREGVLPRFWR